MPRLPTWVDQYIGIPFKDVGRTRAAVDCWGLICLIYRERYQIELPAYDGHYRKADHTQRERLSDIVAGEKLNWLQISRGQEREGDVIVLLHSRRATHVGLVLPGNCMLHIEDKLMSCWEEYDGRLWKNRIEGFYRHPAMPQWHGN